MIEAFHSGEPHLIMDLEVKYEEALNFATQGLDGKIIVFAFTIDEFGNNRSVLSFIRKCYGKNETTFKNSIVSLIIYSKTELFTKSISTHLLFILNSLGAIIPGHPMIEAVPGFINFKTWQKTVKLELREICHIQCGRLRERLVTFVLPKFEKPKLLVLHASNEKSSNTFALWKMVRNHLSDFEIKELHVENGSIMDCKGCNFKTCLHFGNEQRCFYGGTMVDSIYPEVEKADSILWICPNYNDSISANLTAVINRLTALYRVTPFYSKYHFSIIVSGNSGSDSVAKQLIDSLCINKGFNLSPFSTLMATANDPGAIKHVKDIYKKAEEFARNLRFIIKKEL